MTETSQSYPSESPYFDLIITVDSALFGFVAGVILNVATRAASYEPLAARPWSYLATGAVLGVSIWYYDYWRRRAIEEVLYAEERRRYHCKH